MRKIGSIEPFIYNTDDCSAMCQDSFCDRAHQAGPAAAVNQGTALDGDNLAQLIGSLGKDRVKADR
jgi:hypothetical protein